MRSIMWWGTMRILYIAPTGHPPALPKISGNFPRASFRDSNGAATIHKKTMRNAFVAFLVGGILTVPLSSSCQQASQKPVASADSAANTNKSAQRAEAAVTKSSDSSATRPEEKKPDYAQESFVIEQLRSNYVFNTDGTGKKEITARIRVQSEAGVQQWGQLQMGYNSANERLEIVYVRVRKQDASVVKAGDDTVHDLTAPAEPKPPP